MLFLGFLQKVLYFFRYGVGFGIVGKIFGDRFFLNLPNCVYGCIYFVIQASGKTFIIDLKKGKYAYEFSFDFALEFTTTYFQLLFANHLLTYTFLYILHNV